MSGAGIGQSAFFIVKEALGRRLMNTITAILSIFAASAAITLAITALANA
jgi:hypothetical protein